MNKPVLKCVCCSEILEQDPFIDSGLSGKIMAGYGSCHDGMVIQISICDTCLTIKLVEETVTETGNYFTELQKESNGIITEETSRNIWKKLME